MDLESFWEYEDPAGSESRFRARLGAADGDERLELLTQIARALGLQGRFDEAEETLARVENELSGAGPRPRARWLLERGRVHHSRGQRDHARPRFLDAWELARAHGLEGLEVDAAHMVAITLAGTKEAVEWNRRGLDRARGSDDAKARALIPALLNNAAWDLHQLGRYEEALSTFEDARAEWAARDRPKQLHVAEWSVARCLRSLGRCEEALARQRALEAAQRAAGTADGYVYEEIAENLAALGRSDEARGWFARAAEELGRDPWFAEHEAERLARLAERGAGG